MFRMILAMAGCVLFACPSLRALAQAGAAGMPGPAAAPVVAPIVIEATPGRFSRSVNPRSAVNMDPGVPQIMDHRFVDTGILLPPCAAESRDGVPCAAKPAPKAPAEPQGAAAPAPASSPAAAPVVEPAPSGAGATSAQGR